MNFLFSLANKSKAVFVGCIINKKLYVLFSYFFSLVNFVTLLFYNYVVMYYLIAIHIKSCNSNDLLCYYVPYSVCDGK